MLLRTHNTPTFATFKAYIWAMMIVKGSKCMTKIAESCFFLGKHPCLCVARRQVPGTGRRRQVSVSQATGMTLQKIVLSMSGQRDSFWVIIEHFQITTSLHS